jgi:hypothetical protein
VESGNEVAAGSVGRHAVLELPAEQAAVEGDSAFGVRVRGVDPARDAGWISVPVEHGGSLRPGSDGSAGLATTGENARRTL